MTIDESPTVPLYDDALPGFINGARSLEQHMRGSNGTDYASEASLVGQQARTRDVLTLLMLAVRGRGAERAALVQAAARLAPPPAGISAAAVASGNDADLWKWKETLPLPPPKSWLRNWLDVFPR